ncbi:MAG: DNA polymerase I [Thermotogaceae bacterium]|nr:DNA polymerase I [Thermotogaceae bacterium]
MPKLFLFDGTAIAYRAFFALDSSLSTTTGIPTNATYGVARMMVNFIKNHIRKNEDYAAFVMDAAVKTFRHQLYEEYKSHRRPTPDVFKQQIPYIKNLVTSMGIRVLEIEGYEADDVIATLAIRYKDNFDEVNIITGDKDMLQIVGGNIKVWRIRKGVTELEIYDREKVKEKYGVYPEQIPYLLALMGDAVDDVPGVKGIGGKTAVELLNKFKNIDEIYENINKIKERMRKVLVAGKEDAYKSLELVVLRTDVPIEINLVQLLYKGYNEKKLISILKDLEFSSIMKELGLQVKLEKNYSTISDEAEFEGIVNDMIGKTVVVDLETTSLDPINAKIVGISLSDEEGRAFYIPVGHKGEKNIDQEFAKKQLRKLFEGSKIVGQNIKYDLSVLKINEVDPVTPHFDTMIGAWLLNPEEKRFSLDEMAMKFLGYKMIPYEDVAPKSSTPLFEMNFSNVNVKKATEYSAEDADITYRLYRKLYKLIKDNDLEDILHKIEMPLIPVLVDMELTGVYFDIKYLKELSKKYQCRMDEIAEKIYKETGEMFNINSSIQVAKILNKLGIKTGKKTRTGRMSTSASVLEELAEEYETARLILEYRKYQKLKSTYVDAIPKLVNPKTGRVHTSFNQTGTATGRLSSSDPNLQNLPKRDDEGREIRKAIAPQLKGWWILSADYSQIELRVLAHFSGDENLIKAFTEDLDIHRITAAKAFGVHEDMVDDHMRRVGKMINFSIIYGVTAYGLASRLKVPVKEAQKMIESYFKLYPGVQKFIQKVIKEAEEKGEVRTLYGRKREIPQIRSKNKNIKSEGERLAINSPIQGTAADIIKIAMINIHKRIRGMKSKMIMQVHDELVFEVPDYEVEEMQKIVKEEMENAVKLRVPLKVDIEINERYY